MRMGRLVRVPGNAHGHRIGGHVLSCSLVPAFVVGIRSDRRGCEPSGKTAGNWAPLHHDPQCTRWVLVGVIPPVHALTGSPAA